MPYASFHCAAPKIECDARELARKSDMLALRAARQETGGMEYYPKAAMERAMKVQA